MNFDELLAKISNNSNTVNEPPLDGSLFTMSKFLENIETSNSTFYRRYLNHLQYFIGIYDLEGSDEFNRIAPIILRHVLEFGKVALTRFNGKLLPLAISKLEYDIYGDVTSIEGLPIRTYYGYSKDLKLVKADPQQTALLKWNYQALPFIFFWREPLNTIMKLLEAAITGSIASIKKFKRNVSNNSSAIAKIEELSFLDTKTPYIEVITDPQGYAGHWKKGDLRSDSDIDKTTMPSSVEMNTVNDSVVYLWENLKSYMEFEYYQLNRRINTNKKNERNIAAEVWTETVNFDLLDQEYKRYLRLFIKECKNKLNLDIELIDYILDSQPASEELDVYSEKPQYGNSLEVRKDAYDSKA